PPRPRSSPAALHRSRVPSHGERLRTRARARTEHLRACHPGRALSLSRAPLRVATLGASAATTRGPSRLLPSAPPEQPATSKDLPPRGCLLLLWSPDRPGA